MSEFERTDEDPLTSPSASSMEKPALQPSRWQRLRRILFGFFFGYLAIATLLGLLQRRLIYQPYRQTEIKAEDSGLWTAEVHDVSVKCDDQLQLRGWYLPASHRDSVEVSDANSQTTEPTEDNVVVLFFPGNAGNRQYRSGHCQVFTRLGADVLLIDYRGYGDNPGSPTEERLAADAQAIWHYVTTIRKVDRRRVVLFGESLGGGVATRLAAELCASGTPPGGLLLCSTFSSLTETAAHHYPWLPVRLLLIDRFDSAERIPKLTCPLLHVHGTRDRIVPMPLGRRLFDAAPEQSLVGIPKRFVELPNTGHNDVFSNARDAFSDAARLFFEGVRSKIPPAQKTDQIAR